MDSLNQSQPEVIENGKLVVFTNDFFTVYQKPRNEIEISLNEIGNIFLSVFLPTLFFLFK